MLLKLERSMSGMNDLISRAAAIDVIGDLIKEYRDNGKDEMADGMIIVRRYGIRQLPAVDAVPVVHAQWIHHEGGFNDHFECTACGMAIVLTGKWNYCPNCGAKMDDKWRNEDAAN